MRNITFAILLTGLFFFLNVNNLVERPQEDIFSLFISVLFLAAWFLYGFMRGKEKDRGYLPIAVSFWTAGLLFWVYCMSKGATRLWIGALIFLSPLKGLGYVFGEIGFPLIVLYFAMPLIFTGAGYLAGVRAEKKKRRFYVRRR